jgi:hypothetical protein
MDDLEQLLGLGLDPRGDASMLASALRGSPANPPAPQPQRPPMRLAAGPKLGAAAKEQIAKARVLKKTAREVENLMAQNPDAYRPIEDVPTRLVTDLLGFFSDTAGESAAAYADRNLKTDAERSIRAKVSYLLSAARKELVGTQVTPMEKLFGRDWDNIQGLDNDQVLERLKVITAYQTDMANALGKGTVGFQPIGQDEQIPRPGSVPEAVWSGLTAQQRAKLARKVQGQ